MLHHLTLEISFVEHVRFSHIELYTRRILWVDVVILPSLDRDDGFVCAFCRDVLQIVRRVPTTFNCPFCNHEKSVDCRLYVKLGFKSGVRAYLICISDLVCSLCFNALVTTFPLRIELVWRHTTGCNCAETMKPGRFMERRALCDRVIGVRAH
jgi:hypothetical protein